MGELLHSDITGQVLGATFEVWKVLEYGFLEKVYENALVEELKRRGVPALQQYGIQVKYKGVEVGVYVADLFVAGQVIVELKAEKVYNPAHEAQLLNYLKATGVRVGLLLNFREEKCDYKRLIF